MAKMLKTGFEGHKMRFWIVLFNCIGIRGATNPIPERHDCPHWHGSMKREWMFNVMKGSFSRRIFKFTKIFVQSGNGDLGLFEFFVVRTVSFFGNALWIIKQTRGKSSASYACRSFRALVKVALGLLQPLPENSVANIRFMALLM